MRAVGYFIILLYVHVTHAQESHCFKDSRVVMGTKWEFVIYHTEEQPVQKDVNEAWSYLSMMDSLWSNFREDSEISLLSSRAGTGQWTEVHEKSLTLYQKSLDYYKLSDGMFDITVGPLTKLWRKAFKIKTWPEPANILEALNKVGLQYFEISEDGNMIRLLKPGMSLDLGGIAKGYAIQLLKEFFQARDYPAILINGGGDICVGSSPPNGEYWSVAILSGENPKGYAYVKKQIEHTCVATSGSTYQFIEHQGDIYHHHIDPKTGLPTKNIHQVSVSVSNGLDADVISTILVLNRECKISGKDFILWDISYNKLNITSTSSSY